MGHGQGVILGTHLHDHLHFTLFVEVAKGVHGGHETTGNALVGHLQIANVFQTLDGDSLAASLLLVEVNGLHNALINEINQAYADQEEHDAQNLFCNSVHWVS